MADFSLGAFDSDATAELADGPQVGYQKEPQSSEAALRYYSQVYTNGTACDLTDQLRQTEVRFESTSNFLGHSRTENVLNLGFENVFFRVFNGNGTAGTRNRAAATNGGGVQCSPPFLKAGTSARAQDALLVGFEHHVIHLFEQGVGHA